MGLTLVNSTLIGLTLAAGVASWLALGRLRRRAAGTATLEQAETAPRLASGLPIVLIVAAICAICGSLLVYRWQASGIWKPLSSHLDGLLLLSTLLAAVVLFLQTRPRLGGLAAFTLPVLTFLLAWAICAATWTDRQFLVSELHPIWRAVHLMGVYLGTLGSAVAAVAGGMFLVVERRLKRKRNPRGLLRLASLETLERIIINGATLGFVLLTVGLVSGLVIINAERTTLGPGWWYSPKVLVASGAWLVYALLMNVRYATAFRGRRAAWLSISGFVLLLIVYGLVTATPADPRSPRSPNVGSPQTTVLPGGAD